MRIVFRTLAWLFALAATIRGALTLYAVWLAATLESVAWNISVGNLVADHLSVINWAPDLARNILPDHFVDYIFDLPALVGLPLGALAAAALSWFFFRVSR